GRRGGAGALPKPGALPGVRALGPGGPARRGARLPFPPAAAPSGKAHGPRLSGDHGRARRRAARRAARRSGGAHVRERPGALRAVSRRFAARDVALYLQRRLIRRLSRLAAARDRTPPVVPLPVGEVMRGSRTPLALVRLLEGRSNAERESAVAGYLRARGVPFTLHPFSSDEGSGENFAVDLGAGERVLLLAAHHDAVPGSPGANDN